MERQRPTREQKEAVHTSNWNNRYGEAMSAPQENHDYSTERAEIRRIVHAIDMYPNSPFQQEETDR
jgi:hypothetical protein